ncbi:MAG: FtsX-like permease family protein [Planctomycetota bacterium]|jgi:putative ABC transport system permease protein|nr:FtsX-like permease family protein [Planctomycetota bacterium]
MPEAAQIDIKEQPFLSLGRTVKITVIGIRYRLFRSIVTVVVVAVAVAFLMNIISESIIKRTIALRTTDRLKEMRQATYWAARLTIPETMEQSIQDLASAEKSAPSYLERQKLGNFNDTSMNQLKAYCEQAATFMNFFTDLDYGRRRALVRYATGVDIFARLQDEDRFKEFETTLSSMRSLRFPTPISEFKAFLKQWPTNKKDLQKVIEAKKKAITEVSQFLGERPVKGMMSEVSGDFGDVIRKAGFELTDNTRAVLAEQGRRIIETEQLEQSINNSDVRRDVAGYLDKLPTDIDLSVMWRLLERTKSATWYADKLKKYDLPSKDIPVERLVGTARLKKEERALQLAGELGEDVGGGMLGLGERMSWLVLASMMVCIVGIANAMLMSVTERFREIATLKCLGALDGFIMLMFVLEACFLGVVGGFAGAIIGNILGIGRMLVVYGTILVNPIPFDELFVAMSASMAVGIVLAAVASVYPSFKAAKLAPMEAMRIE